MVVTIGYKINVDKIPKDVFPNQCYERRLYQMESEHQKYRAADTSPVVIVGPSYASQLGSFKNAYNVSLGSGSRAECDSIVSQCGEAKKIFYIVSIREYAASNTERCRPEVYNQALRKLAICRGVAQMHLGIVKFPPFSGQVVKL